MEDRLKKPWNTTKKKMEDDINFFKIEDYLIFILNFLILDDDLN